MSEGEQYARLDEAFRRGDMAALRTELGGVEGFPNVDADRGIGLCLVYAIYWSPLALIEELLGAGADPNGHENDGFPPLIAAFDRDRFDDKHELLELLLSRDAEPGQRGINDYTPLHVAAERGDLRAVEILLAHGADPNAITRIDDMETPLELAEARRHAEVAARLKPLTARTKP